MLTMVLLYANSIKKALGGVEIFNKELEELIKSNGKDVFTLSKDYFVGNKFIDHIYRAFYCVYLCIFKYNVTSIIVQHSGFLDILIIPILKMSFKPVYTIHHIGKDWKHIKNIFSLYIVNLILSFFVKKIFVINEEQRSFLKPQRKMNKIHTIINHKFSQVPLKQYHNKDNYILYIGRIHKEKGIDDLIEAYRLLRNQNVNLFLKIIGPVDILYKKELEKKLKYYQLNGRIMILPPIYDVEEKIKVIDNCLFGIYPSYKDAFPLVVLEFFARNKLCLASKMAETKYFVQYEEFLFCPGNINEIVNKINNILFHKYDPSHITNIYLKSLEYAKGYILNDLIDCNVI